MYYICYNSVGHLCCVVSSWLAPISFKVWGWKRLPEAALPSNSQQLPPRLPPLRACTRLHTRSQQQTRREEQPLLSWWSCLSSWAEEQPAAVSLSLSLSLRRTLLLLLWPREPVPPPAPRSSRAVSGQLAGAELLLRLCSEWVRAEGGLGLIGRAPEESLLSCCLLHTLQGPGWQTHPPIVIRRSRPSLSC